MKKIIAVIILSVFALSCFCQDTYFTRSGHIYFISHTDVIDIDANNKQVASFLDVKTGQIQFAVLIKSFDFSLATAKEHFNESYMESDNYPKASFKGIIQDIEQVKLNEMDTCSVLVKGDIRLRGIKKNIEVQAKLIKKKDDIQAHSEFELAIADFNITVPQLVENRVAKTVQVKVDMNYRPYK